VKKEHKESNFINCRPIQPNELLTDVTQYEVFIVAAAARVEKTRI